MTYEEIVYKLQEYSIKAKTKEIKQHIAVQFNIYGEGEGALYIEISGGRTYVEPYEYFDRDALMYVEAKTLFDVIEKRENLDTVLADGRLVIQGYHDEARLLINSLIQ